MSKAIDIEMNSYLKKKANILAEKWDLAAQIWHNDTEIDLLEYLLNYDKKARIMDIAAGNGFHLIKLIERGYKVDGLDGDKKNIEIIKRKSDQKALKLNNIYNYYWQKLPKNLGEYDYIFCIGTSITYFDSWKEGADINTLMLESGLLLIIENFKKILKNDGTLILGISDYYEHKRTKVGIKFPNKVIKNLLFTMNWEINFDWNNKIKNFNCYIKNERGEIINFELYGYLFDYLYLKKICKSFFSEVSILEIDNNLRDIFLICKY